MTECPVYGIVAPSLWGTDIARSTEEQKITINNIKYAYKSIKEANFERARH